MAGYPDERAAIRRRDRERRGEADEGRDLGRGLARNGEMGQARSPGGRRGRTGGVIVEPHAVQQITQPRPAGVKPDDLPPAAAAWAA